MNLWQSTVFGLQQLLFTHGKNEVKVSLKVDLWNAELPLSSSDLQTFPGIENNVYVRFKKL